MLSLHTNSRPWPAWVVCPAPPPPPITATTVDHVCARPHKQVGIFVLSWQVEDLAGNPLLGPGVQGVVRLG
jgi:hypothetical protein